MRSLLRAVQCTESLQKSSILDRRLPSKVSMSKKFEGGGFGTAYKHLAGGFCLRNA